MTRTLRVELGERSYDVRIAPGAVSDLGEATARLGAVSSGVIISDETVAAHYGRAAGEALRAVGLDAPLLTFPPGEPHKTFATYGELLDAVLQCQPAIDRRSVIIALGGGVTGDLAGFVAATCLRGLRFVQCPTTLLADVDSAVGGKTGVDHAAGKNLIGAFHQPSAVVIDVQTLGTLSDAELRNGLAECVKHAVIRDADLLTFIDHGAKPFFARDVDALSELVARNVAIKAAVVAGDEREYGDRAHLNFGHTVGHAIEVDADYTLAHGSAVALGMLVESELAVGRGLLARDAADRLGDVLERLGLPVRRAGLSAERLGRLMQRDKKARAGKVRFVLPTAIGSVTVVDDVTDDALREALQRIA
ncbi:MAG: 3-dehydroquinate synthase [Phycisphaerae bacterium]|nr:3-dehydroquinate synthase [Phycisphaerae bacterium]